MVESVHPLPDEISYVNGFNTVHASPLEQRWGGWWVTGNHGGARHMGNIPVMPGRQGQVEAREPAQDAELGRRAVRSDRLSHAVQRRRGADGAGASGADDEHDHPRRLGGAAGRRDAERGRDAPRRAKRPSDLVDYLLFVDEAPFAGPMQGSSGFAEWFAKQGPARRPGPLAARLRPAPPAVQVPLQLHDLHAGVRRAARRRRRTPSTPGCGRCCPAARSAPVYDASVRRRPSGHRSDSARHEERSARPTSRCPS